MTINNFISRIKNKEKEEPKFFLAVEINAEIIKSALWIVDEGKTKVVKIGSLEEWDGENKELLLTAVDNSISISCAKQTAEPQGVIFGLPKDWIENDQIIDEKKELLKYICQKLELKPLGFVASLEALAAQLKKDEGAPLNAIIVQIQENQSSISLIQIGKIIDTHIVGRSNDLAADVKEGLARFKQIDNFPSRIIIFDSLIDLEEYKQQLTSYDWLENMPFLHFPKVEILENNKSIKAIAISGGTEVAKSLGFEIKQAENKKTASFAQTAPHSESKEIPQAKAVDLGFVQDKDVLMEEIKEEEKPEEKEKKTLKKEILIQRAKPEKEKIAFRIKKIFSGLRLNLFQTRKKIIVLLLFLGLFFIIAAGFILFQYAGQTKITLFFNPTIINEQLEFTIDPLIANLDQTKKIIPGELEKLIVEGEKTINTTGKKIIGEKAKGEITIFNKTAVPKTFPSGTILIGSNDLKFTLEEEITVASKSAEQKEEGEEIVYGKTNVNIAAASIGQESNLPEGSVFTFKDYQSNLFSAKNSSGLSGGTSRQIKAVDQEDMKNLSEQLIEELKQKAINDFKNEKNSEKELITQQIKEEILNQNFSAEKDEEADELNLKLKVSFSAYVYNRKDLEIIILNLNQNKPAENLILNSEKMEMKIEKIEIEKEKAKIKAKVKAYFLPQINSEEVKSNLKGFTLAKAEEYFDQLPNFSHADIEIKPSFFIKLGKLPFTVKNITIDIKTEE